MPSQIIPCAECAGAKHRFEERGFRVLGCEPHDSLANMCDIRFEMPALAPVSSMAIADAGAAGDSAPGITLVQARTAQAIVNLFETSEVLGRYDLVTLLPDDPGRLTYGRSQTTLGSGNLHLLLARYCHNQGARFASQLQQFLPALQAGDQALDSDTKLHNLLRACADDPVMRDTQDGFFDQAYWQPALRAAGNLGVRSPLAAAVVYDSHIHGSWSTLRKFTNTHDGTVSNLGEQAWIRAYVRNRRAWLASHKLKILRSTVYRMDAFQRLIDLGHWGLEIPLVVRGTEISMESLSAAPPNCYEGPPLGSRALGLQRPLQRGLDVRLLQLALSDNGSDIKADGIYGQGSANCVREMQIARGLAVTGVVDIALIGELVH